MGASSAASRRRLLPRRRAPPSSAWRSFPSGAKPPSTSPPMAPTSSTSCVSACAGCASVTSTGSASTSPLGHPSAQTLCPQLEALGFFFAGIIPELVGEDVLRLQYLNEVETDLASVQLASDFARELFEYVTQAMGRAGA